VTTSPKFEKRPDFSVLVLLLVSLAGCQSFPGPAVHGDARTPRITLQRGVTDSTLAMKPPYLSGRDFSLTFSKKTLFGWVSPATGGGALRVRIDDDSASGFGPHGPVGMDIVNDDEGTVADGFWDGQRVHLSFAPAGLRGTVADARQARGSAVAIDQRDRESCQYLLDRRGSTALPVHQFEGFSICAGLPQRTLLEVPPTVSTLLSRAELVTVLVAMLSAPPLTQSETTRMQSGFESGFDEIQ
jgi:hypothetical protein